MIMFVPSFVSYLTTSRYHNIKEIAHRRKVRGNSTVAVKSRPGLNAYLRRYVGT